MQKRKPITWKLNQETGCHDCTSHGTNTKGTILCRIDGKTISLVRYIYSRNFGPIFKSTMIRCSTGNNHCINPQHLKQTSYEQLRRKPIEWEIDSKTGCYNCISHADKDW